MTPTLTFTNRLATPPIYPNLWAKALRRGGGVIHGIRKKMAQVPQDSLGLGKVYFLLLVGFLPVWLFFALASGVSSWLLGRMVRALIPSSKSVLPPSQVLPQPNISPGPNPG